MLTAAVTVWQVLLGALGLAVPTVIGVSKLYTRVALLEGQSMARDSVLVKVQQRQDEMAKDLTEIRSMLSEVRAYVRVLQQDGVH